LFKPLKVDYCLFNPNSVSVTEQKVTILIIWSLHFHFKYLELTNCTFVINKAPKGDQKVMVLTS